jgi:hypothetical protein
MIGEHPQTLPPLSPAFSLEVNQFELDLLPGYPQFQYTQTNIQNYFARAAIVPARPTTRRVPITILSVFCDVLQQVGKNFHENQ